MANTKKKEAKVAAKQPASKLKEKPSQPHAQSAKEQQEPVVEETVVEDEPKETEQKDNHEHRIGSAVSVSISNDGSMKTVKQPEQKLASIKINYPKGYKKRKYFPDGHIVNDVLEQHAKAYVEQGFAEIVK